VVDFQFFGIVGLSLLPTINLFSCQGTFLLSTESFFLLTSFVIGWFLADYVESIAHKFVKENTFSLTKIHFVFIIKNKTNLSCFLIFSVYNLT